MILRLFILSILTLPFLTGNQSQDIYRCPAGVIDNCKEIYGKYSQTKFHKSLKKAYDITRNNTIWLEGRPSVFQYSRNVKNSFFISAWYDFIVPTAKTLSPIKFVKFFKNGKFHIKTDDEALRGPLQKIFDKLWKNSNYSPTTQELITLKKYNRLKRFNKIKNKLSKNPRQHRVARYLKNIRYWATFLSFYIGIGYGIQQYQGGLTSFEKFVTAKEYVLQDNQVQILIDDVPFPHLGLRIGSHVYSYGQTHMTKREMGVYFDNEKYVEMLKEMYPEEFKALSSEQIEFDDSFDYSSVQLGNAQEWLFEKTGLNSLPKTLTAININLKPEEYTRLKNYLESHRAHRYKNLTGINDCASMIAKALKKNTDLDFNQLIDASPGQIGYALSLMKMAGDKRVGDFYQVSMDSKQNDLKLLSRNTYIHMMESKLFIHYFLFNQTIRSFMELYYKPTDFVTLDPQIKKLFDEQWKTEYSQYYNQDPRIVYLYDFAQLIFHSEEVTPQTISHYEDILNSTFKEISFELKEGKYIDFYDNKKIEYKKESLCEEFTKIIKFMDNEYDISINSSCNF